VAIGLFGEGSPSSPRPRAGGEGRLETRSNSVRVSDRERVEVRVCLCKCRLCPRCGPVMGRSVQRRLLGQVPLWKTPVMMTLTIDPKNFVGPDAAYDRVREGRYVARLMESLGVVRYVVVLEFQKVAKGGWPHWHVLIDKEGRKMINLKKAWSLWRDKWGNGGVDLTLDKRLVGQSVEYAMRYICKYMVKFPLDGFPEWIKEKRNVRFIQGSRCVGALVREEKGEGDSSGVQEIVAPGSNVEADFLRGRLFKTVRERVEECGRVSALFSIACGVDRVDRFEGSVNTTPARVAMAGHFGLLSGVDVEVQDNGYGKRYLRVFVEVRQGETLEKLAERVEAGVALLDVEVERNKIPSSHQKRGRDKSWLVEVDSSLSVTVRWLAELKRHVHPCTIVTEQEAVEGALDDEPSTDAHLRELIEESERRTTAV